jgi:hypothetical protein
VKLRPWQKTLATVLVAAAIYGAIDYGIRHTPAWHVDAETSLDAVRADAEGVAAAAAVLAAILDGGVEESEADAFTEARDRLSADAARLDADATELRVAVDALRSHASAELRSATTEIQSSVARIHIAIVRLDAAATSPAIGADVVDTLAAEAALVVAATAVTMPVAEDFDTLADGLFSTNVIALEVLGVLLTAAMIGAMVIARPLEGRPDSENYPTKRGRRDLAEIQRTSDVDRNLSGEAFAGAAAIPDVREQAGTTAWPDEPPSQPQFSGGEEE